MSEPEPSDWVIYSDTSTRMERRGIRAGQLVKPAPVISPGRWAHAVAPDSDETMCGQSTAGLKNFSATWRFRAINPYLRCPTCDDLTGHPST